MKNILLGFLTVLGTLSCEKNTVFSNNNYLEQNEDTEGKVKYLALGDSYTIGQSVLPAERWPVQLAEKLNSKGKDIAEPTILATTGWTTGDLLRAIKNNSALANFDIVSLMIGVNNQYQHQSIDQFRKELSTLIEKSISLVGNNPAHVIVLSIPDWGVTPAGSNNSLQIAGEIDAFNQVQMEECQKAKVQFIDITASSRTAKGDSSLIAKDNLHFSGKMYSIWSDIIAEKVGELFKKRNP